MTAGASRRRANRWGILGVKGRGRAFEVEIGAAFQQSNTAVPAKNAVIVAGGANFLRFSEPAHGLFDQRQQEVRRKAHGYLRAGPPLVKQAARKLPPHGGTPILD